MFITYELRKIEKVVRQVPYLSEKQKNKMVNFWNRFCTSRKKYIWDKFISIDKVKKKFNNVPIRYIGEMFVSLVEADVLVPFPTLCETCRHMWALKDWLPWKIPANWTICDICKRNWSVDNIYMSFVAYGEKK